MNAKAEMLAVTFGTVTAFAEPEICERSEEELLALSKKPEFSDYSYRFERLAKDKNTSCPKRKKRCLRKSETFRATSRTVSRCLTARILSSTP